MANISRSRKSGYTIRGGVKRRETAWLGGDGSSTALATPSAVVLISSLNAAALQLRPFTVVRTRGLVGVSSDQQAATEDYGGAFGICVVSDQAIAIGVTAVPTPITDDNSDLWFMIERVHGRFSFGSNIGFREVGQFRTFDSRAMRKVEEGQDLSGVVESEAAGYTASGCIFKAYARILIKLH